MKLIQIAIALFFLTGCAARPSGDDTSSAREAADPRAVLYKRKCISCHNLVDPKKHTDDKWTGIFKAHQNRLHLKDADKNRLIEYLTENN